MRDPLRHFYIAAAVLFALLLFYSQTGAFSWDEGFHLLAAQLIKAGKRPYIDFCFPQTPLNAYLTAAWMRLFGDSWRAIHALEAFWVAAAAFLTADFIRTRFPVADWRWAGTLFALVAVGLNPQVVLFGTIGQSYGLCLFLIVAAFRLAVAAVERRGPSLSAAAGFLAGAAAASSLLTATVAPILFFWIAICNRAGNRWSKLVAFAAGGVLPWLPVLWLYRQGPQQALFNLIVYQLKYRHHWDDATRHDISELTSWIDSAQGLALAFLVGAGFLFLIRRCDWPKERRSEFYLSLWVALGLTIELATAHPTFERYFLLAVPFLVIPAIVGLYVAGTQLIGPYQPMRAVQFMILLFALGIGKAVWEDSDSYSWKDVQKIADKVNEVTPPDGTIWADELIYCLTHRPVPDGMQFAYAHDIEKMPADQMKLLHILTAKELQRRALAGTYATVAACYDTDNTDAVKIADLYRQKFTVKDCTVYWDWIR